MASLLLSFSQSCDLFSDIEFFEVQRMEFSNENFRFYILVEVKRGVAAKDIHEHLCQAFNHAAPSQAFVYKWHKSFSTGDRVSIETLPRSGRPSSQTTVENISRVFEFVETQPKTTLSIISDSLQLSRSTVHRILVDELLFRKVCSVWVPHKLTDANKQQRVTCSQSLLDLFNNYSQTELLRVWATQDESWVPFNMIGSKEDNKVWIAPETPRPTVCRPELTFKKTMMSIVFTGNGKVSVDVTERGETVDSEWYIGFVHKTGEKWRKLRSDPTRLIELLWQHDNARPHTSTVTKKFFEQRKIIRVEQSPYSPDLNQCDRWLFKELKKGLRQKQISSPQDVMGATLQLFHEIPPHRFIFELQQLKEHCEKVIACGGDYITNT
jgi:histone-lysine N-methyltransferase SETMAR